jgi:ubiquinone/menaquinone biosynthesis C-methylase UbiE
MFRAQDREKCQRLFEKYYAGRQFHDGYYRAAIRQNTRSGDRLLDAGCGRYLKFSKEIAAIAEVVGIDLESTLETNNRQSPFGVRGDLNWLPFRAETFDVVISRSVVEHLANPRRVFHEFARVLKRGGKVILITPNKYDYVSLIAAITPYSWHRTLCSRIFGVAEDDVYPTHYRANTIREIGIQLRAAGFMKRELLAINHYPAYLSFSPLLFRLGILYERLTSLSMFRQLRGSLLCVFEKNHNNRSELRKEAPEPTFSTIGQ